MKLLPQATAAKVAVDSAIPLHITAIAAANGYPGAVTPVVTALTTAVTNITFIQTKLIIKVPPPIAPPSKIGVNVTGAILTQLSTVLGAITTAGVAAPLMPEPASVTTFGTSTGIVTTQLPLISAAITTGLITPQTF